MKIPNIPECEAARLQALTSLNLLDTEPEEAYEAITSLVKTFFDVPIVAISLVDAERQWFKSIQGLDVCETSREVSFCGHAILQNEILVVEDALLDKRFAENPLVLEAPKIRFYAGCPLQSRNGYKVGTLCIIDTKPRQMNIEQLQHLKKFAALIEQEFFMRRKSVGYLNEIAKIQDMYISGEEPEWLFSYILDFLIRHTGSQGGYIGIMLSEQQTQQPFFKNYATSMLSWNEEKQEFSENKSFNGLACTHLNRLFQQTLKTGENILNNHVQDSNSDDEVTLKTYLAIPVCGQEGLIAMFGLINRPDGYDAQIVKDLEAIIRTITTIIESSKNTAVINELAKKDSLTGVYNRYHLKNYLTNLLNDKSKHKHAFILVDFDNFKEINDYYGHDVGDNVLQVFSKRLQQVLKKKDFIARVGGDEFVVFLQDIENYEDAGLIAEDIVQSCSEPFQIESRQIECSVSIGIAGFPLSAQTYDMLARAADLALYKAKANRGCYAYYTDNLNKEFNYKVSLTTKIKRAFKNQEFYFHYQPQFDSRNNKVIGVEALLRWDQKVSPAEIVTIIETLGMWKELNRYVVQHVVDDLQPHKGLFADMTISVNICLGQGDYKEHLLELADSLQPLIADAKMHFGFEITEGNHLFRDDASAKAIKNLAAILEQRNITLAIDDFGIKQSSLNRLIEGEFRTIKIDKSYIDRLNTTQSVEAIAVIRSILTLAQDLEMKVIAEGVELQEQLELLNELGVNYIQGYLFSKPVTKVRLLELLEQ